MSRLVFPEVEPGTVPEKMPEFFGYAGFNPRTAALDPDPERLRRWLVGVIRKEAIADLHLKHPDATPTLIRYRIVRHPRPAAEGELMLLCAVLDHTTNPEGPTS